RLRGGRGGGPSQWGAPPGGDGWPKEVVGNRREGPFPRRVATGQEGEEGLQPRAERPCGHTRRQRGTGACAAGRAGQPVPAVFRHLGLDGRDLGDLVPAGGGGVAGEGPTPPRGGPGAPGGGLVCPSRRGAGAGVG